MSLIGELACTYSYLILHDDDIPINAERIDTLIKASNLKVESYWPSLFAKLCLKRNVDELIMNVGTPASTSNNDVATPPSTTDNDASTAPSTNNKKKEEIKEESDDEAMFSLFD